MPATTLRVHETLNPAPSLRSIWLLLLHRRPALAEAAARQRLALDPADWETLVALTEALQQQDRLEEAAGAAIAALQAAPDAAETHYSLAQVRGLQGRLPEADAAVLQALRLNPYAADYYAFRAQLFYLRGSYSAAISCADEGLRLDAHQADCLLWRALAREQHDNPAAVDEDFRRLLRIAPESGLVHARLGQLLLNRYQPGPAGRHLAEALRQDPEQAPALVPLLRRARRQQHWPAWLLRSEQQAAENRAWGFEPGWKTTGNRIFVPIFAAWAWWLTRKDPLFRQPLPKSRLPWPDRHPRLVLWLLAAGLLAVGAGLVALFLWLDMPGAMGAMIFVGVLRIVAYIREQNET